MHCGVWSQRVEMGDTNGRVSGVQVANKKTFQAFLLFFSLHLQEGLAFVPDLGFPWPANREDAHRVRGRWSSRETGKGLKSMVSLAEEEKEVMINEIKLNK